MVCFIEEWHFQDRRLVQEDSGRRSQLIIFSLGTIFLVTFGILFSTANPTGVVEHAFQFGGSHAF